MRTGNKRGLFAIVLALTLTMLSMTAWAAPTDGPMLLDDFNRASLGLDAGGAYNTPNSKGIQIYWINWSNATPKVENNALKLEMKAQGWFGEGGAIKDPAYKYIVIKVKGEKGGEEKALSLNPDAKGAVKFTDLKGADGKPVPAITKDYQNIIIDIAKSGFKLPEGLEALHFNNTDAVTIYIDEIYLSKDGKAADLGTPAAGGDKPQPATSEPKPDKPADNTTGNTQTGTDKPADDKTTNTQPSNDQTTGTQPAATSTTDSSGNKGLIAGVIGGITVLAIGGVVYVLYIRKPN